MIQAKLSKYFGDKVERVPPALEPVTGDKKDVLDVLKVQQEEPQCPPSPPECVPSTSTLAGALFSELPERVPTLEKVGTLYNCGTCMNTYECEHCGKCGKTLSIVLWKKQVRVKGPDGVFRARNKSIKSLRCLDCSLTRPVFLGHKITPN